LKSGGEAGSVPAPVLRTLRRKGWIMRIFRISLLLTIAVLGLAACQSAPPAPVFPDLRFTGEPPIGLTVAQIDIQNNYVPTYRPPNVEYLFPVPPAKATQSWARDRLRPVGPSGVARFTIRNASVTEVNLPQTEGIKGAFTTEPSEQYNMVLQVTLEILDARGLVVRTANVTATRSQGVLNTASPNERDKIWYDMTSALMVDFDRQMTSEIHRTFGPYATP
jgi:outer membrane lipopolysaccharide assembly protein LptE/RlpB